MNDAIKVKRGEAIKSLNVAWQTVCEYVSIASKNQSEEDRQTGSKVLRRLDKSLNDLNTIEYDNGY